MWVYVLLEMRISTMCIYTWNIWKRTLQHETKLDIRIKKQKNKIKCAFEKCVMNKLYALCTIQLHQITICLSTHIFFILLLCVAEFFALKSFFFFFFWQCNNDNRAYSYKYNTCAFRLYLLYLLHALILSIIIYISFVGFTMHNYVNVEVSFQLSARLNFFHRKFNKNISS